MNKIKLYLAKTVAVVGGLTLPLIAGAVEEEPYLSLTAAITQIKTDLFGSLTANLPTILAVVGAILIIYVMVRFAKRLVGGR
jgi:hypothetical protein